MQSRCNGLVAISVLAALLVAAGVAPAQERSLTIPPGSHGGTGVSGGLSNLRITFGGLDRRMRFQALFTNSAAYVTRDPANQWDWNKLMGLSTLDIHRNSIRLGWRWVPSAGKMELGFYGYWNGTRYDMPLAQVNLNEWVDVELTLNSRGISARVGTVSWQQAGTLRAPWWMPIFSTALRTAYFGGDETAPQAITIRVRNVSVQ